MRRYIRTFLFVLVAFSLLLSACQSEGVQPDTAPTQQVQIETSSPTVKPTKIIIPTSTSAPTPSDTPEPSPAAPLPTPNQDWTTYRLDARMSVSPDGRWIARIVVAYPPQDSGGELYHTWVRVTSYQDDSIGWTVVDEWLTIGLGMATPFVLRWTQDGSSVFIADTGVPDGCGPSFVMNVRHVDLQSGEVTPLDEKLFGKLSVSPDGSALVAFSQNTGLVVHDLTGGDPRLITFTPPAGDWWPGEIVWSPDGREFLFDLSANPCGPPEAATSSIWHAVLEGSEANPLIQDDPYGLSLQSWPEACLVQLRDRAMGVWWLDPCTIELSQNPPSEVVLALDALLGFFDALHQANYADAAGYYGGSYEILQYNNPSVDANDLAALWENACQFNGFVCLPVLSHVLESQPGADEFRFSVVFDREGEAFVLGPCCGASAIDQPPVEQFIYTVKKDAAGAYRVQELPVYTP